MSGGLDVIRARVALRHRPFSDVLDLALRFIVVHWKLYAKVSLVTLLPGILGTWLVVGPGEGGWVWGWIVGITWTLFAQVPFTSLASRLVFEDTVRARDVVKAGLRESFRVFVLRILTLTATALAFTMLFVPAAWVAIIFCFSTEVLILERATVGGTLGRSQRVAQSDFGESLLMVVIGLVTTTGAVFLADQAGRAIIEELLQFRGPPSIFVAGGSVLGLIGLFGIVPYVATARFFTYLNIRTRAEGWDIQTRFAALAARADEERVKEAA
jgi:hypothetical protein